MRAFQTAVEKGNRADNEVSLKLLAADSAPPPPVPTTPAGKRSSPTAPISVRESIGEYSASELENLLRWVKSDGKLRTNEELVDEMFEALPFSRRGSKIEAALQRTIARG